MTVHPCGPLFRQRMPPISLTVPHTKTAGFRQCTTGSCESACKWRPTQPSARSVRRHATRHTLHSMLLSSHRCVHRAACCSEQALTGERGDVMKRFSGNADCQNAYKNYFCWLNFPRCNADGESLIMCRSVCNNYFKSCKVPCSCGRRVTWCDSPTSAAAPCSIQAT